MPRQLDPRNNIVYDWPQGDSTYKDDMDANLRHLGSMLNVSVTNILATPPGSPNNGDSYIVGASATGAWVGQENNIAIWFNDDTQWRFFTPTTGLTSFVTTGTFANQLIAFNGTNWSTNGFTFTFA